MWKQDFVLNSYKSKYINDQLISNSGEKKKRPRRERWHLGPLQVRALALKNANAISKPFLAFYGLKCAASKDAKHNYCKKFYNSATVQFYL